ncbi:MAG TPA: ABC transporter permease subunit [Symbiobacteriaceae bacterium]|nr:ABC transporter permease subunit [Symbiobacteriaceae bacterium]
MGVLPRHLLQFLLAFVRELLGLAILLCFAIGIATLPPLGVEPTTGWLGFRFRIGWAAWGKGILRLYQAFTGDQPLETMQGQPLGGIVIDSWRVSLILLLGALVLAVLFGVLKGVWDFRQLQRRRFAFGPLITAAIQGMPDFFLLLLVQWVLIQLLRQTGELFLPVAWVGDETWQHYIVPLFCLTIYPLNGISRVVTTGLQEVWAADFVRTGRAKGLREQVLLWKHAMRNVMVQLLDTLPLLLSLSFANLLILEYLCNIPGLTKLLRYGIGQEVDARFLADLYRYGRAIPIDSVLVALSGMAIGLTFWALWGVVRLLRPLVDPRLRGR